MRVTLYLLMVIVLLCPYYVKAQFNRHYKVKYSFAQSPVPPVPDYADSNNWAALPGHKDAADVTPDGVKDDQADAKADVFYIYPTTYYKGDPWNADVHNKKLNKFTDKLPVEHQATIFNGSCKIYAPRYRQAHMRSFFMMDKGGKQALDLAYQDVKAAFQYYLDHYNHGRPIVIAGHSQGAYHAIRLVKEFFDGKPLASQLVVAYLVGMPVKKEDYQNLHVCEDLTATGCYVSWATFAKGYYPEAIDTVMRGAVCVNPITWTTDTTYAPYNEAKGMTWVKFRKVYKQAVDARIHGGVLWIDPPKLFAARLLHWKIWHIADFNLFWMDVRDNVKERITAYFARKKETGRAPVDSH